MIRPRTLRPSFLQLALGGALLGVTAFAYADQPLQPRQPHPIFCWVLCLMMCKVPNCFPIKKRLLMPYPKATR